MAGRDEGRIPKAVVNLLRDLAVAFLLVAVVFAALFAFARTWPPMVVVESGSMQHSSDESFVGVIDTGDIVVVQAAPRRADVVSYVEGRAAGHATYGDFGDVIVFRKPGMPEATPIIHRAVLYLAWNASANGFDVAGLPDLDAALWETTAGSPYALGRADSVTLLDVGYRGLEITFSLDPFFRQVDPAICQEDPAPCSGYVTMGDHNAPSYDQALVRQDLVLGRARGELPWFGLLKLVFGGGFAWGDPRAPANSWSSLAAALVLLVVGPIALDVVLSFLAVRRVRRSPTNPAEAEVPPGEEDEPPGDDGVR